MRASCWLRAFIGWRPAKCSWSRPDGHDGSTGVGRGGLTETSAADGGDAWVPAKPRPDETLIRALARAHRCKRLADPLEQGDEYRAASTPLGVHLSRRETPPIPSATSKRLQRPRSLFHHGRRPYSTTVEGRSKRDRNNTARPACRGDRKSWTRGPPAHLDRQAPELDRDRDVSL